jgi:restriction endonuclease S subunit
MENLSVISRNPSVIYIGAENIDEDRIDGEFYNYKYLENEIKLKKSGIKIKVLNDVIERMNSPIGWQGIPSSSYLPHGLGVPLIRVQNVSDLILDEESLIGVEESIYDEQPAIQAQPNDIIITRVGTIGRVCRIPEKINRIAMGQNLTRIKLNETLVESGFMLAYMSSKFCQIQMERYAYGGVQASLTNKNIKQLLVPIPSPEIQKYIGDKIRKAEELREEAKRLKKDAEEIFYEAIEIDKLNSKLIKVTKFSWIKENQIEDRLDLKYNSPSIITIYEHFRKYKCSLLKDEFKTISGYAFSSGDFDDMDGEKVIKIGDISDFTIDTTSLTRVKIGTKVKERIREFSCNIQDLVYAMTGATIGKVAMYIDNETVYINQRVACIKPKRNNIPTGYLLLYLNSDIGKEISYSLSTGVAQPNIALEELNNIVIPQLANNIMDKIHHNVLNSLIKHKESKQLIQEAKQDVEDLIEGNFDMSKVKANS